MSILEAIYPRSRLAVVDSLLKQHRPMALRQLAKISRLSLRATQVNIEALEKMGLILSTKLGNKLQISLNESHALFEEIQDILRVLEHSELSEKGKDLSIKATKVLKFIDEGAALVARAKSSK